AGRRWRDRRRARAPDRPPRHWPVDRALPGDARPGLARRLPRDRPRRPKGAGGHLRPASPRARGGVAPLARLRRHAPLGERRSPMKVATMKVATGKTDTDTIFTIMPSPIGRLTLAGDGAALSSIYFEDDERLPDDPAAVWKRDDRGLRDARRQLEEYF